MTDAPSRKRAAATLGVSANAGATVARSAFFRKLESSEFLPSEEWCAAAIRLGALLQPITPDIAEMLAGYERCDVEEFLATYWSCAPKERRSRWEELDDRCRDADSRAMLSRVRAGLNIPLHTYSDPQIDEIASVFRTVYPMSLHARSIHWTKWCVEQSKRVTLGRLFNTFGSICPELASLMPDLLDGERFQMREYQAIAEDRLRREEADLKAGYVPSNFKLRNLTLLEWIAVAGVLAAILLVCFGAVKK